MTGVAPLREVDHLRNRRVETLGQATRRRQHTEGIGAERSRDLLGAHTEVLAELAEPVRSVGER